MQHHSLLPHMVKDRVLVSWSCLIYHIDKKIMCRGLPPIKAQSHDGKEVAVLYFFWLFDCSHSATEYSFCILGAHRGVLY